MDGPGDNLEPVELVVVTLRFDGADVDHLGRLLATYVVMSRGHDGCRNIDLCASVTVPGRFLVIEKWTTSAAQRAHFDSPEMVALADACRAAGVLVAPPEIDLYDPVSAHDLA